MLTLPNLTEIDFDEERHLYTVRGVAYPSVTQIMEPMSLMLYKGIPDGTLNNAADRGTRTHEQVSNYVTYGILEKDEDNGAYLDAFLDFERMYNPAWVASEYRVYHKILHYAGTMDLVGYITPDDGTGVDVIDLKCTAAYHGVMLATQIAGYVEALRSHGIKVRNRYGLQLLPSGKFRFEQVADGYKTFLHCLGVVNAMQAEIKA